jgi:hypothetical protein
MAITERGSGAVNSASTGTAISITHGLSISSGDIVLAFITQNGAGRTFTDNNGATPFTDVLTESTPASTSSATYAIRVRVAGASEPASYAWTSSGSDYWGVQIRAFPGVHADIWDVTPSTSTRTGSSADGTTAIAPAMTINTAGALGLCLFVTDAYATVATYSGVTNGYAAELEGGTNHSMASYTRIWASTGSTGTTSATLSITNDWTAHQFALKPAAGGTAVPVFMHHYQHAMGR